MSSIVPEGWEAPDYLAAYSREELEYLIERYWALTRELRSGARRAEQAAQP